MTIEEAAEKLLRDPDRKAHIVVNGCILVKEAPGVRERWEQSGWVVERVRVGVLVARLRGS